MLIHQRRNRDLSHMIHLHDELVSLAGHELRNPLAALSLQIRILKDAVAAENQGHIVKIATQSEQNVKRIENLLDRMIILLNNSPIDKLQ